jgi:hypothetical protein
MSQVTYEGQVPVQQTKEDWNEALDWAGVELPGGQWPGWMEKLFNRGTMLQKLSLSDGEAYLGVRFGGLLMEITNAAEGGAVVLLPRLWN